MSRTPKRTKTTPKRKPSGNLTIREYTETRNGVDYTSFMVQGWKEDGKWKRRKFKSRELALGFISRKQAELLNVKNSMHTIQTPLTPDQVEESAQAIKALGDTYTLSQAIEFFLKHNRPPEFTITILDGLKVYLDEKEHNGTRETTRKRTQGILRGFASFADNPEVHTVTEEQVKTYLATLRTGDGLSPAKRKTFNNHRNELASFFLWAGKTDLGTNRPWTFNHPLEHIPAHSNSRVAEQRPDISTTPPETLKTLFTHLMGYKGGKLVKWYALAYFSGIRPSSDQGELSKLAERENELINLTTGTITIPASIAKTKHDRQIIMPENLIQWLKAYAGMPIMPANFKNDSGAIRKLFALQQDETRHSFISYHVALHRSLGDVALQAGNSETMIRRHYLNLHTKEEGGQFFSIVPDMANGEAVFGETPKITEGALRVV